jgi:hypothetical protein
MTRREEHLEMLIARLHESTAATERECLGLHAALHEAIRRLSAVHIRTDDLLLALENPGSAPLNWRGGNPQPKRHRSQSELAQEYTRIFGNDQ